MNVLYLSCNTPHKYRVLPCHPGYCEKLYYVVFFTLWGCAGLV
jgi:hypothetical protein